MFADRLSSHPTCQIPSASFPTWRSVWDMATGKEMSKLEGHGGYVQSVAISRDGKTIVSGSYDRTIRYGREAARKLHENCLETAWKLLKVAYYCYRAPFLKAACHPTPRLSNAL